MNFSWGQTGTKVRCESRVFSQGKTPEFTKMGEFMNFSFWPLLWFGLAGRLLIFMHFSHTFHGSGAIKKCLKIPGFGLSRFQVEKGIFKAPFLCHHPLPSFNT